MTTTAPEVVVEPARWVDLAGVAALERRLFPDDAWSEASWWAELAGRPRREYLVLRVDGALAGYAGLDHGGEVSDVMTVAVDPAYRGRGLGGVLLDALDDAARARGAAHVMLEVRADNDPAVGLYEGRGYVTVSRRRGYYGRGTVDALVMRRTLSSEGAGHG